MATDIDSKKRGFTTLDACIRGSLMDIGETESRYEQFRHFAIDAVREFHFDMATEVKTVSLELQPWKAVFLPDDFVDWCIIGVKVNGTIRAFTHDDRIPFPTEDEELDGYPPDIASLESLPITESTETSNPDVLGFYNFGGGDPGGLFGLVVKDNGNGYFRMNKRRREIQFAPSIKSNTQVYLEYIADAISICEKTVINIYAGRLVRLFIHRERLANEKSASLGDKKLAEERYEKEYYKVQNRLNPITVEDVLECARDGYRLTPWI